MAATARTARIVESSSRKLKLPMLANIGTEEEIIEVVPVTAPVTAPSEPAQEPATPEPVKEPQPA